MTNLQDNLIITLQNVQAVTIHGSPYYDVTFVTESDATPRLMRINPEAFYANPQAGDRVEVNMLMGNIMGARKLA